MTHGIRIEKILENINFDSYKKVNILNNNDYITVKAIEFINKNDGTDIINIEMAKDVMLLELTWSLNKNILVRFKLHELDKLTTYIKNSTKLLELS